MSFRNGPLYRDTLEVILQLVSLIYCIRYQISVVFSNFRATSLQRAQLKWKTLVPVLQN